MQMTLIELEVAATHQPDKKAKQNTPGLIEPEQAAIQKVKAFKSMPARERIARRMQERNG